VYGYYIHGFDDLLNQQIGHVLEPSQIMVRARPWKASGCTDRATGADAVRYASVDSPPGPPTAHGLRRHQTDTGPQL